MARYVSLCYVGSKVGRSLPSWALPEQDIFRLWSHVVKLAHCHRGILGVHKSSL